MKRLFIPLILALCLTACGFHLRGMVDVPVWLANVSVYSKDGTNQELISLLKTQLEGYKVFINPDPALAKYWLIIDHVIYQQKILNVGASTNPRQYQLSLAVGFMLQTRQGQIIKAQREVLVTRQLTINNDRILGSNEEEAIIINEMRQDAVVQIINRLSHK